MLFEKLEKTMLDNSQPDYDVQKHSNLLLKELKKLQI